MRLPFLCVQVYCSGCSKTMFAMQSLSAVAHWTGYYDCRSHSYPPRLDHHHHLDSPSLPSRFPISISSKLHPSPFPLSPASPSYHSPPPYSLLPFLPSPSHPHPKPNHPIFPSTSSPSLFGKLCPPPPLQMIPILPSLQAPPHPPNQFPSPHFVIHSSIYYSVVQ